MMNEQVNGNANYDDQGRLVEVNTDAEPMVISSSSEHQDSPYETQHSSNHGNSQSFIYVPFEMDSFIPLPTSSSTSMPSSSALRHKNSDTQIYKTMKPQVYSQRWVQLGYLSMLALLSDWICFSTASTPEIVEEGFGHSSARLIDIFLFMNVFSSFVVTDVVNKFGLKRTTQAAAVLMAVGAWFRSGLSILPGGDDTASNLVPYPSLVAGTLMVGAAQPFFQCTPPLLSAQWFASDERATSTAIALNFNQIGIATAFLVGGSMATTTQGLQNYFTLISALCTVVAIGTIFHFQHLPPTPPSASELEKLVKDEKEPPFTRSIKQFFSTPGFTRPLAAFICSIAVTNIVGAFIDEVMQRGGITKKVQIVWAGVGFELAIVIGGILFGGYVDRTKEYKKVTLACLALSIVLIFPLGLTDHTLGKEPLLLVLSLLGLGMVVGPVQPINAELAVDVVYPGDETAVESIQQIGGNLVSAILVPLAEKATREDFQLFHNVPLMESDIRGDVVLLVVITVLTYCFYRGFYAPLRRTLADRENGSSEGQHSNLIEDDGSEGLLDQMSC